MEEQYKELESKLESEREDAGCLMMVLVVVIFFLIAILIASRSQVSDLKAEVSHLSEVTRDLTEEVTSLEEEKEKILTSHKRDRLIVLETDSRLLVASLAWIDNKYGTHYLEIIDENYDGDVNFAKIKELFDKDEDMRLRGVRAVSTYMHSGEDIDLLTISPEYYDYLISKDSKE